MPAEQPQTHVDHLVRGFEAEDFAWTVVESVFDGGELLMGDEAQIHALREELSDEAIGVLVGAALPGAVRVTEEGLPAICSGDQWHRRPLSRKCGSATFRHPRGGRSALAGLGALRMDLVYCDLRTLCRRRALTVLGQVSPSASPLRHRQPRQAMRRPQDPISIASTFHRGAAAGLLVPPFVQGNSLR